MILNFFKKSITNGILIVLPMLFILWLLKIAISLSSELLEPFSRQLFPYTVGSAYQEFLGVKILKFLVLCCFVGIVYQLSSQFSFARKIDAFIIQRIPIYNYIKNVLFQFIKKNKLPFREVVYIKVNTKGDLALGFISEKINTDKWAIFIPTSPNPTTGAIRIVAKEDIYPSNLSFDKAISILITCGSGVENNQDIFYN